MKRITLLLIIILSVYQSYGTGSLVSISPDSAFQGTNINVTITYPAGTLFTYSCAGDYINLYGAGLPTLTSWWNSGFNPFADQASYYIQFPLTQTPGVYNVEAFAGHWDPFTFQFVADDTFHLQNGFIVVQTNVYGQLFIDNNGNGSYQPSLGDRLWGGKKIDVYPDSISVYTDYNGQFLLSLPPGSHTIQYTPGPGETITSGNSPVTINVTPTSVHNLGSIGVQTPPSYKVYNSAWLNGRCNRVQNGYVNVYNASNRQINATTTLIKSSNIDIRSMNPAPAIISGDTIIWNFTNMNPGSSFYVTIVDSLPSAGDTLKYSVETIAYNGTTPVDTAYNSTLGTVRCAWDPNDKAVNPAGIYVSNYTLTNEDLHFHINFQNTGNDTAFDVRIIDTLDADLDLSTFEFLGTSSPAIVTLNKTTRIVVFKMNNILLPDSNINEPKSHGYVDYKISAPAGTPDLTEITNTAYIYFDFNPPVATNTTLNTLIGTLPVGIAKGELLNTEVSVYPNPFNNTARLVINNWNGEESVLTIWNALGEMVTHKTFTDSQYILRKSEFSQGLFFYKLQRNGKNVSGKFILTEK